MKIAIIVLSVILGVGIIFSGVGGIVYAKDPEAFTSAFTEELEAKSINEVAIVSALDIRTSSEEVEFKQSIDEKLKIEYFESENRQFEYSIAEGVATFKSKDNPWNLKDMFQFLTEDVVVTIYVPSTVVKLDLEIDSGNASWVHSQSFEEIGIVCASGNITFENINVSGNLHSNVASGKVILNNVQVEGEIDLDSTSGEINITDGSCNNLNVNLTSGNIDISTLVVSNEVSLTVISGNIISSGLSAENITSSTTSGNVELGLKGMPSEYRASISVISGSVIITGQGASGLYTGSSNWGSGEKDIDIEVVSGNTTIRFEGN